MFGQLLFMRLRAAEKALADVRLEEAYRLATQADIRDNKRGKTVLAGLSEKFVARAREFYRADRFSEALMDLDRAEGCGDPAAKKDIDELRGYVRLVASEQARKDESQIRRVQEARERIERGSLAAGRNLLERAEADHGPADALRRKAEERSEEVSQLLDQVRRLLDSEQWAVAAERLRKAKSLDGHAPAVAAMEAELCEKVIRAARSAIVAGRIPSAQVEIESLRDLGKNAAERRELEEVLRLCSDASNALASHCYADARRHAMSIARLIPEANWANEAMVELRQIDERYTVLAAGPLGTITTLNPPFAREGVIGVVGRGSSPAQGLGRPGSRTPLSPPYVRGEARRGAMDETIVAPAKIELANTLPSRLLLLVDGGGSYLLVRGSQASMGRAASDLPADMPLLSDISERHANISRVEDDYFVISAKELEVDGKMTRHALLRDGNRVVLGRKAKFTFRLPSRRSSSALLELSDTTKMPNDVRRVVLFDRIAMIGQGNTSHVQCRYAGPTLLLYERNGGLWLRAQSDGFADTTGKELRLGESVEVGGVSLALEAWRTTGKTVA
ncbi:MAG: hypothetical protein HY287_12265 [Planctomycetes bacterium]|nr:hypothetical protein [Planctomycetota bacterium]MBI3835095.1 hypothetical protein [Planctomycetota bacterium]